MGQTEARVRQNRRRWPVIAVVIAAAAVTLVHVSVDRLTRDPPNYARVEDGLWIGGAVAEPPPSWPSAVLSSDCIRPT